MTERRRTTVAAARHASAADAGPPVTPNNARDPGVQAGRNTIETILFRGISTPIALVLVVLQSRFLEASGRGAYVLAVVSVTIFSRLLGQLGLAVTSWMGDEGGNVTALTQRALGLGVGVGAIGTAVVVGWGAANHEIGLGLAFYASLALVPNIVWQTISGVLLGLGNVRTWNYVQLLSPVLSLVSLVVIVVGLGGGVRGAAAAWALAQVITAAYALWATRDVWRPLALPRLDDHVARTLLRLALTMGAVQVINLVSYRAELFVLSRYRGLADVGIYSIAQQAAESIWLVPAAIATGLTAPVVREAESVAVRLVSRAALRGLLFTAGVGAAVGVAAPWVIPFALGEEFRRAALPLGLLLPGVVAYAPVTILVVYLSVRRQRPGLSLAVAGVGLVVTTAASLLLVPRYGASGAAAGSAIGYGAAGALAWVLFARLSRD